MKVFIIAYPLQKLFNIFCGSATTVGKRRARQNEVCCTRNQIRTSAAAVKRRAAHFCKKKKRKKKTHFCGMGFRVPDLFAGYLRHNDINDYLDYLAEKYPNLVSICVEGHSYEGRPLKSIRISYSNLSSSSSTAAANSSPECSSSSLPAKKRIRSSVSKVVMAKRKDDAKKKVLETAASATKQQRPIVLLDGGIHAREWISVATALYCIYQLTERHLYNKQLLKKLDFIIVPVVNIDGYEYSHTNVSIRMHFNENI